MHSLTLLSLCAFAFAAPGRKTYNDFFSKRDKYDAFGWTLQPSTSNVNDSGPSFNPMPKNFTATPVYRAETEFDFDSLQLGIHQEYIELDLFNHGLTRFYEQEFIDYGLTSDEIHLIRYFAQQEIGHAQMISNLLGEEAAHECEYAYNFESIAEFFDFCQRLTRWGESGVYGFLPQLDNRALAQMLLQSIATEARQQYSFRQFLGLFPVPIWFETGATQAMTWTLLSQHIVSCPPSNFRRPIVFPIFPRLNITSNNSPVNQSYGPAISTNRTALSEPGNTVSFNWQAKGVPAGPYNQVTTTTSNATAPVYAAWLNQYNITYTELADVTNSTASAIQPGGLVFDTTGPPIFNGTMFVMLTDSAPFITPANLSLINDHILAGPALYIAG